MDFKYLAELLRFKTCLQNVFELGNLGEKYLDLNKNIYSINLESAADYGHLIARQKKMIEDDRKQRAFQCDPDEQLLTKEIEKYAFY